MNKFLRSAIVWVVVFLCAVVLINSLFDAPGKNVEEIPYNKFREAVLNDNVKKVMLRPEQGTYYIEGEYKSSSSNQSGFITTAPIYSSDKVVDLLEKARIETEVYQKQKSDGWLTFLASVLPFVIIFVLFFFLLNQAQGGGGRVMNFGKSKAKLYTDDKKKVMFDDVAGADEEKFELVEVVEFLKDPRKFAALGARIPKGVLLFGPPGTGKTLLARACAGEAGVPFFSISGSDFVEMFVGVGASRVRDLFENAKKNAPCIIFIDEIDAVGRQRGAGLGGGHDEREQTLNQLLVEMDGFSANEGIIIIAATNRPDILDPALLRPGRFDRQITVNRPDIIGREAILKVHAKNKPLSKDVTLDVIARGTPGFTGADLENLLNEAALISARRAKKEITMSEIDEAVERVIAGPEKKSRLISPKEKNIVAYHESGHAIIGFMLDKVNTVHKVTIIPRGRAGGYALILPREDRYFMTKEDLLDSITVALGGRVAEELALGEVSTGASHDFQRATSVAKSMVTEYGMSKLGPIQFGRSQHQVFLGRDIAHEQDYSDNIAYEIDKEIQRIIHECYERAKSILTEKRIQLETMANALLERETLDAPEIKKLMENTVIPS